MLRKVEGFDRWVAFAGFRSVHVGDLNQFLSRFRQLTKRTAVQFLDADLVAGWEHLYFSVLNALKAFETGMNISNSLAVECLLYASAQRQISSALELIGVKARSSRVAVVVVADKGGEVEKVLEEVAALIGGRGDDKILELSERKIPRIMRLFGISRIELGTRSAGDGKKKAISDLVIEHVALLAVQH